MLSGYVGEEKIAIAKQYLLPTALKESGLSPEQVTLADDSLKALIKSYCRESGVRNLQKHIEKVPTLPATPLIKLQPDYIISTNLRLHFPFRLSEKLHLKLLRKKLMALK